MFGTPQNSSKQMPGVSMSSSSHHNPHHQHHHHLTSSNQQQHIHQSLLPSSSFNIAQMTGGGGQHSGIIPGGCFPHPPFGFDPTNPMSKNGKLFIQFCFD